MFLADYHCHSHISPDGRDAVSDMAGAAVRAGMAELAITDHFDMTVTGRPYMNYRQADYFVELRAVSEEYSGRLRLVAGVELGQPHHCIGASEDMLKGGDYDFVLGSLHWLKSGTDFYGFDYSDPKRNARVFGEYLTELLELSKCAGCFDVLSHLTLPIRYMGSYSMLDLDQFEDGFREIFGNLVQAGKGIEINASGFYGGLGDAMPDARRLRLFRECGGEIVTVGSDAHYASDVGGGIRRAYAMLGECGFRYVTVFRDRRPEFIEIGD